MRALPKKFYILVPHLHDLSSAVSPVLTSGPEALEWVMPMGHVQWVMIATMGAGSEGSLKAYQLESWVTLLEKSCCRHQQTRQTTGSCFVFVFCWFQEPKKSKKTQGKQCMQKSFWASNQTFARRCFVLCSRVVGRKKELADLWSYAARAEHFVCACKVYVHRLYPSFF